MIYLSGLPFQGELNNNSMVPESPSVINGRREAQINVGEVTVSIT